MPDLATLLDHAWQIALTLGGSVASVASFKVVRFLGGMEEKFSATLKSIAAMQNELKEQRSEVKGHGETLSAHTATLSLLIPALAALPTTSKGNGGAWLPIPNIDELSMSEWGVKINQWVAQGLENERLMQEEKD